MISFVSIVIPTQNRSTLLMAALRSLLSQSYREWEALVVDDDSSDGTADHVAAFTSKDPRIRYFRQERGGVSKARNLALQKAVGQYIAFLDDDDEYLPDKLAVQVNYLNSRPEIGFIYGQTEIIDKDGKFLYLDPKVPVYNYRELFERSAIRIQTVMCRRECFDKAGLFDEALTIGEDYDLWLRMARHFKFAFIEKPLVRMRFHGQNTCNNYISLFSQRIKLLKKVKAEAEFGITFWFRQRRIAENYYRLGRLYRDEKKYLKAARYFAMACCSYPVIGVIMAELNPSFRNVFRFSLIKPYFAILYCLWRAITTPIKGSE
ncbi:MAG: glycosyltransferase [Candidatus Omnitrophica bacterium]|nr:glycosyltransferase [Candidatus Omnitrophota bacterium]